VDAEGVWTGVCGRDGDGDDDVVVMVMMVVVVMVVVMWCIYARATPHTTHHTRAHHMYHIHTHARASLECQY